MDLPYKYATTATVYYCNLALGVTATFFAPILIHFRNALRTDTQTISLVMTVSRVLALISALTFGCIFNYLNRHAIITVLVFLMGLTTVLMPYINSVTAFAALNALSSVSAGGYLTAQVVWIIEIWRDESGPYIQAQHFFFALGCIFPPLILAPYLSDATPSGLDGNATTTEGYNFYAVGNGSDVMEKVEDGISLEGLRAPCAICGGIIAAGALFLLITFCAFGNRKQEEEKKQKSEKSTELSDSTETAISKVETVEGATIAEQEVSSPETENKDTGRAMKKIILIVLSSSLIGGVESMEGITMSFLPVYAHYSSLHLSEVEGANLLSAYSIAYTVARGLGILMILKVPARWILGLNLLLVVIANLVLLYGNSLVGMYAGSIILGVGFSTSVPSVFAYVQAQLEVTNIVGSILMVAGAFIASVFPVIVGSFIEKTPTIFMYLNLGCVGACLLFLAGIVLLMRNTRGRL